jgi:hypothetical protein
VGDPGREPDLQIVVAGPAGEGPVADGDQVPLFLPPQGGRVILAGVRALNVDPCALTLLGSLRDPRTQQVRLDARTVNLRLGADGRAASAGSDISTFANIPVCPNQWSPTDLFASAYQLTLTVTDRGGRRGSRTVQVSPRCGAGPEESECACICRGGYVLGQACAPADGGPP